MMGLTLYGFFCQYKGLAHAARLGSGAREGYRFLATTLKDAQTINVAKMAVKARLVSLGREVNNAHGHRQAFTLDQIAVLEHFLEEVR